MAPVMIISIKPPTLQSMGRPWILLFQVLAIAANCSRRGFEVGGDVGGDHFGGGEVGAFFEGFVFEPEDVEVDLVALDQLFVGEGS